MRASPRPATWPGTACSSSPTTASSSASSTASWCACAGQQFVILAAPTRSGKGVGVVIPNLLDYQESMVVLDIKQENFDLTSGWRASRARKSILFNPFAEDRRTHRWNPLSYVSQDPAFRISDLQSIAAMLYPDGSDDQKFWVSQARNAFMAFALYLFEKFDEHAKAAATRMSSGPDADAGQHLPPVLRRRQRSQELSAGPVEAAASSATMRQRPSPTCCRRRRKPSPRSSARSRSRSTPSSIRCWTPPPATTTSC